MKKLKCTICGKKKIEDSMVREYAIASPNGDYYDLVCEICQEELHKSFCTKLEEMKLKHIKGSKQ